MKIRFSPQKTLLRLIGLAAVVPMAFSSPPVPVKGAATASLATRSSESWEIKQPPDLSPDGQPDKKPGVHHYVVGMTLSFNTAIQNPQVHVELSKKDDRSQTYTLQIDSPEPVTFQEDASLSMDNN